MDELGKVTPSLEQKNAFAAESVRLKAQEGKLKDFCRQTGRRTDAVRTKTASWNRSTSQKAVWANKKAVDNKGGSGIIKSILVDDIYSAAMGKSVDKATIDVVSKHFAWNGSEVGYYADSIVVKSIPKEIGSGVPLMQINPVKRGNMYETELILNEDLIGGKTIKELDDIVLRTGSNLARNFEEAVIHETGHAKTVYANRHRDIAELYGRLKSVEIERISDVAFSDGAEAIAEIEILYLEERRFQLRQWNFIKK